MLYNERYGILWKFSPSWQIALGRWDGYILVWEVSADSREYKENDYVKFTYNGRNWNKLVEYIKKCDRIRG